MRFVEWVVKPSTYCNLRCRYCYEWNGLANTARMELAVWSKVARGIVEYHRLLEQQAGEAVTTRIIWHGGEPFALPQAYFRALIEEVRNTASVAGIDQHLTQSVQTNLTILNEGVLQLINDHQLRLGISMDVIPGLRLSLRGMPSEAVVLANMAELRRHGIQFGAITVLASHTCKSILRVFDYWASERVDFRVLPLFAGPPERDASTFDVDETDLVHAMCVLFDRWMASSSAISVAPLAEWLVTSVRHRLGLKTAGYDRQLDGESVLIVRSDGSLFLTNEVGLEGMSLGNLGAMTVDQWMESATYVKSFERSRKITETVCRGCKFRGACDSFPAHTERFDVRDGVRCPVTYQVFRHIDHFLATAGYDDSELRRLAGSQM